MKKEIEKKLQAAKAQAETLPATLTTEQIEKLKEFYHVKTMKKIYQLLTLDIDNSQLLAVVKILTMVIVVMLTSVHVNAQRRVIAGYVTAIKGDTVEILTSDTLVINCDTIILRNTEYITLQANKHHDTTAPTVGKYITAKGTNNSYRHSRRKVNATKL